MQKVTDLINNKGQFSYSFEITPDISEEKINNLSIDPTFYSVTWHAKTHQCIDSDIAPLRLAKHLKSKQKHVLLHLSCDMLKKEYLDDLLTLLQKEGICNLFVVLGERFDPALSDFKSTTELISYIRQHTENYFCIGVAGYPGNEQKLLQLKEKIDNGAEFIITQAFFESVIYKNFVHKCRELDINVPIIPGIFIFETYKQLDNFINLCKIKVSESFLEYVKSEERKDISGTEIVKLLIKDINVEFQTNHFHFFTLNKLDSISNFVNQVYK